MRCQLGPVAGANSSSTSRPPQSEGHGPRSLTTRRSRTNETTLGGLCVAAQSFPVCVRFCSSSKNRCDCADGVRAKVRCSRQVCRLLSIISTSGPDAGSRTRSFIESWVKESAEPPAHFADASCQVVCSRSTGGCAQTVSARRVGGKAQAESTTLKTRTRSMRPRRAFATKRRSPAPPSRCRSSFGFRCAPC